MTPEEFEKRAREWLVTSSMFTPVDEGKVKSLTALLRSVAEEAESRAARAEGLLREAREEIVDARDGDTEYALTKRIDALLAADEKVPGAPQGPHSESRGGPEGLTDPAGGAESAPTGTDLRSEALEEAARAARAASTEHGQVSDSYDKGFRDGALNAEAAIRALKSKGGGGGR